VGEFQQPDKEYKRPVAIFPILLRLWLTSFGGPIAHIGYFRQEFVERRKWLDEHAHADLVSLCQFLPGPAYSQVGIALGLSRGGIPGTTASWLGFTLPSAVLLVLFGLAVTAFLFLVFWKSPPWLVVVLAAVATGFHI
jgi:chromate transporter